MAGDMGVVGRGASGRAGINGGGEQMEEEEAGDSDVGGAASLLR